MFALGGGGGAAFFLRAVKQNDELSTWFEYSKSFSP